MVEDSSQKSSTTIRITWKAPVFSGGASIIDYRVNIAKSDEDFKVVDIPVVGT